MQYINMDSKGRKKIQKTKGNKYTAKALDQQGRFNTLITTVGTGAEAGQGNSFSKVANKGGRGAIVLG